MVERVDGWPLSITAGETAMVGATRLGTVTVRLLPEVEDVAEPPTESFTVAQ
jgi:hypothetical protein